MSHTFRQLVVGLVFIGLGVGLIVTLAYSLGADITTALAAGSSFMIAVVLVMMWMRSRRESRPYR